MNINGGFYNLTNNRRKGLQLLFLQAKVLQTTRNNLIRKK